LNSQCFLQFHPTVNTNYQVLKYGKDGKPAHGHMRILTDSATVGKRNRKEVLTNYNKKRINIGQSV
jgi:hypothetical protein